MNQFADVVLLVLST